MPIQTNPLNKLHILSTLAFVVFSFAVGEMAAILLTGLLYNLTTPEVFDILKSPAIPDRPLVLTLASSSTLFRFLIVPGLYLLFMNKSSLRFLWTNNNVRLTPLLLILFMIIALIPFTSILMELNQKVELPVWLSALETYFKDGEETARLSTNFILSFSGFRDLIIVILLVAVIPGILEEFFFRGMVQLQIQKTLKNHHSAILLSSFLFSSLHFQFYGFVPRMVMGILFGYLFFWSKNIWYPSVAHVMNNLIGVLGVYFFGPEVINSQRGGFISIVLLLPSVILSVLIIVYLKRAFFAPSNGETETATRTVH